MSNRNSFGYYDGRRGSPFLSNLADAAPRNLSGHFEYISPDHDLYNEPSHRPSLAVSNYDAAEEDPDRVHVRYMLQMLPIQFPAYAISEETAFVNDLRNKVADYLRVDPRRVRLVYKGRDLKHNSWPLRRYHMKQNSEVACIITDAVVDYNNPEGHSESGSDSGSGTNTNANRRQRPRSNSTYRQRSDDQVPMARPTGAPFLHPNGHVPSISHDRPHRNSVRPSERDDRDVPSNNNDRLHRNSLRPSDRDDRDERPSRSERSDRHERVPSRNRGVSPSPAPPIAHIPAADPNTPTGKLQALTSTFNTKWLPDSTKFLLNPPSDQNLRKKEAFKFSEGIMTQIVLKADDIDTEGNVDARAVRKTLVNEANKVMKELDKYKT